MTRRLSETAWMTLAACALPALSFAQSTEERLKELENRLNRLESAPAAPAAPAQGRALSAFNPSIGMSLDTLYRHQDDKARFDFRSAELNIGAPIDPFLKGWAIINANDGGVGLEEATVQTTALPHNLQVTAGRMFSSFGRLARFHNHELPVPDRPTSLDRFIGGEAQGDGLEVSYLVPVPFYLNATVGAVNKLGSDNDRRGNGDLKAADEFTYLGRAATSGELGSDHSIELGLSGAFTPKRRMVEDTAVTGSAVRAVSTAKNTWRWLTGADLTYRYHPAEGGLYKGLTWSTEVMCNNERRFNANTRLPTDRVRSFGGLSYVMFKLGRHWRPTLLVDLAENLDAARELTKTYAAALTYDVSEYQKVRLGYARTDTNVPARSGVNTITLQWTAILGYHVHGFRDR